MNENKVSEERIRGLIESSEKNVTTIFGKVTVVSLKLPSGFVITESSGCVDPENYDEKTGELICMGKIEDRLWELEGYLLQNKLCEEASEKDIDKFKVKVEPGESPFDCLGREFFSLARDKFKIHGYDDPDKFYAFKVIGKLYIVKHGDNLILLETGDTRETLINMSRRKKFVTNTESTEVKTQGDNFNIQSKYFCYAAFDNLLMRRVSEFVTNNRMKPQMIIVNPKTFSFLRDKPGFFLKYGSQNKYSYKEMDIYASRAIANVNDFELF